jgi:hypothetical protein
MPLPGTRVIPDGWSAHHRPTATGTMTGRCTIRRTAGEGTTGADGTWTPDAGADVYDGPCRLQALSNERVEVAGETQDTVRRYLVVIEHDADHVEIGDEVEITAAKDAQAVGMTLRIVDVRYGTEQWERDLIAEETYDEEEAG